MEGAREHMNKCYAQRGRIENMTRDNNIIRIRYKNQNSHKKTSL